MPISEESLVCQYPTNHSHLCQYHFQERGPILLLDWIIIRRVSDDGYYDSHRPVTRNPLSDRIYSPAMERFAPIYFHSSSLMIMDGRQS